MQEEEPFGENTEKETQSHKRKTRGCEVHGQLGRVWLGSDQHSRDVPEPALFGDRAVTGDPSENNSSRGLGWEQRMDAANVDNVRPILNVTVTLKIALRESVLYISLPASHFYFHLSKEKQSMHRYHHITREQCNKTVGSAQPVNELETISEVFRSSSSSPLLALSFDLSASHRRSLL